MIKRSAAAEIRQLLDALGSDDEVRREAAIARLAIAGTRAVERLVVAYDTSDAPATRMAILRTLEAIADPRAIGPARRGIERGGDEALAAAATLRALLDSKHGDAAAASLDALVSIALNPAGDRRLRLTALEALQGLPEPIRQRIAAAVPGGRLPAPSTVTPAAGAPMSTAVWEDALEGRLPDDPGSLRDVLSERAASAPLTELRRLIDVVRAGEASVAASERRRAWLALRGAAHQSLALRGSRIALYDLRETVEQTREPLPSTYVAALQLIGDASCLPPLAAAFCAAPEGSPWKVQLRDAFHAVAKREKITRRHAVMKRVAARSPDLFSTP